MTYPGFMSQNLLFMPLLSVSNSSRGYVISTTHINASHLTNVRGLAFKVARHTTPKFGLEYPDYR